MAAKTGQRDAVRVPVSPRAVCPRKRKTAVYSRLEESPGSFAFAQAVHIIRRYLSSQGVTDPKKALRFRVNPNLSFPPGDMEGLTFTGQGEETRPCWFSISWGCTARGRRCRFIFQSMWPSIRMTPTRCGISLIFSTMSS